MAFHVAPIGFNTLKVSYFDREIPLDSHGYNAIAVCVTSKVLSVGDLGRCCAILISSLRTGGVGENGDGR